MKTRNRWIAPIFLAFLTAFFLFALPALAAKGPPDWNLISEGYSTPDSSPIWSVSATHGSDENHYRFQITLKSAQLQNGRTALRVDFEHSQFLPDGNASFYGTPLFQNGDIVAFEFADLLRRGDGNYFAFYYTNALGITEGPLYYKVPDELLNISSSQNNLIPSTDDPNPFPNPSPDDTSSQWQQAALKPRLLVSEYSYGDTKTVTAGRDFTLSFTLKNYSHNKTLENVMVTLTPSAGVQIKSATNTYYFDQIPAGKTVSQSVTFQMSLQPETDIQTITLESAFQYYDKTYEDPADGESKVVLTVPSGKITRAKLSSIKIPKNFKTGKESNVEYTFINNGFSTVYNAEATVYNEAGEQLGWQFIGNVESGKQADGGKLPLKFQVGGLQKLRLVISYEDDRLLRQVSEQEFTIDVEEKPVTSIPDYGNMGGITGGMDDFSSMDDGQMDPSNGGGVNWPLILAIAGAILLLAGILFFLRHRKQKRNNYDDFYDAFPEEKGDSPAALPGDNASRETEDQPDQGQTP